ncbi:8794_t:CDS:2 [Paraglomus brasilianum]|uniref:8794_t:CDS:1 n=1 Tax=Paraglomus brasilianum TaxID=144538 RepID=A0A9N8ZHR0_9GLOM|nr:8794_t:CDS:2 [Paraglomus brasilianum]
MSSTPGAVASVLLRAMPRVPRRQNIGYQNTHTREDLQGCFGEGPKSVTKALDELDLSEVNLDDPLACGIFDPTGRGDRNANRLLEEEIQGLLNRQLYIAKRTILILPNELSIESTNPVTLNEEDDNDESFRQLRTVNHRTSASDELDEIVRYLALDSIGLNDDPLKWWQIIKIVYQFLLNCRGNIFQFLQLQSLLRDYPQMLGTT